MMLALQTLQAPECADRRHSVEAHRRLNFSRLGAAGLATIALVSVGSLD